jgi:glutamine synthetase
MPNNLKTPEDILRVIKDDKIQMIDLRFTDLTGRWQQFSVPACNFGLESFEDGVEFDGSSIRGFHEIQEPEMLVIPDPASPFLDPFSDKRTLALICNIRDPVTGQMYTRDPRFIAQKAEAYLQSIQMGDAAYFGPILEHFVFDQVRCDQSTNYDYYEIDGTDTDWSAARHSEPSTGPVSASKAPYLVSVPPADLLQDVRTQMVGILEKIGIGVEARHEGIQSVTDMRFATLTRMADNVMILKYVVKKVARQRGMAATFMPRPLFGHNGSGMYVPQSIWWKERPLFAGDGYAGSSALMRHYIAGLLEHAPALLALSAPTVNSYRRLAPGFEAPVHLGFSQRNRSMACRIPSGASSPNAKRVEFRCADPSCNAYLAFAAMLMAGIDGFDNRYDPGQPIDKNLYDLPPDELARIPCAPGSLEEALDALEADNAFLLKGDVFTPDVIETYLSYKRTAKR